MFEGVIETIDALTLQWIALALVVVAIALAIYYKANSALDILRIISGVYAVAGWLSGVAILFNFNPEIMSWLFLVWAIDLIAWMVYLIWLTKLRHRDRDRQER